MVDVHARLIRQLEQVAGLDRELEFLPTDEVDRRAQARPPGPDRARARGRDGLLQDPPLLASCSSPTCPRTRTSAHDLERYFPPPLPERYAEQMRSHRLRREIIATVVANQLVDRAGTTFVFRLREETGRAGAMLARAYAVAREVFDMRSFWPRSRRSTTRSTPQVQLDDADRGPAAGRARDPLARPRRTRARSTSRATTDYYAPRRADAGRGAARRARRRRP